MYAFQGCGRPSGLGSYANPWDAPSITGQLQVMSTGELRFSVPGHNFNLQYAANPATRAAFELHSFGGPVTVYGTALGYGIYSVETWEAGAPAEPFEPGGPGGDAPPDVPEEPGNGGAPGGGGAPAGGGAPGGGGAPAGGTPAAAPIPWTPILALGALLLLPTLRGPR